MFLGFLWTNYLHPEKVVPLEALGLHFEPPVVQPEQDLKRYFQSHFEKKKVNSDNSRNIKQRVHHLQKLVSVYCRDLHFAYLMHYFMLDCKTQPIAHFNVSISQFEFKMHMFCPILVQFKNSVHTA